MAPRERPLLIGWNRSPYARRVAISMNLLGIGYDQEHVNAWDSFERVQGFNPIAKIPALVTETGEIITESWAILDWLDCRVGPERALMPPPSALRDRVRRIVALAGAITDKSRELRYERHLRPEGLRHQPWVDRWSGQISAALHGLEGEIESPFAAGERLTQADITVFVMVESLLANPPHLLPAGRHPAIERLHARCCEIDAFRRAEREDLTGVTPRAVPP